MLISEPDTSQLWFSCGQDQGHASLSIYPSTIKGSPSSTAAHTFHLKPIDNIPQLDLILPPTLDTNQFELSKEVIAELIGTLKQSVDLKKVVLSFTKDTLNTSLDCMSSFQSFRSNYPHCLTFLICVDGQVWLGASPELVLIKNGTRVVSRALAGTIATEENWTHKEIQEQSIVCDEIETMFNESGVKNTEVKSMPDFTMGNIKHLMSSIQGDVDSPSAAASLSQRLHPSSALSGYPRKSSYTVLKNLENFDRQWFTGLLCLENKSHFISYALLRCVQVTQTGIRAYMGAGITAQSQVENEYAEYLRKYETILDGLVTMDC